MWKCAPLTLLAAMALCALASSSDAGVVFRGGLLEVDGKPFFPLGTWSDHLTTPEELAQLGMNVHFIGIGPSAEGPANLEKTVKRFSSKGIMVIPYFGYGGASVQPWAKADLEAYLRPLADSPGILAWYIGDDLTQVHLPGMKATADTVHAHDRTHPVVADYIAEPDPEGQKVFRPYLDIMCQYGYPIPDDSLEKYADFFDTQRLSVGDPLWTWIQAFMWGHTARELRLGAEGPGPLPEPEQVRLLTYVALNRGVRGLLFFAIQHFRTIPEISAEIALLCREIHLLEPYLAGGKLSLDIQTSDQTVKASSFARPGGAAVALVVMGENYHRWVDDRVLQNVSFTVSCKGAQPRALLVTLPEPVECPVERLTPARVRVTVPSLELGGLVLVTSDASEIERIKRQAKRMASEVAALAVEGATAQYRKVAGAYWLLGSDGPGALATLAEAHTALREAHRHLARRQPLKAVASARRAMRQCRRAVDAAMRFAQQRQHIVPESQQIFLKTFYGLPRIAGLGSAVIGGDYRFVRDWMVIGPFPLQMDMEVPEQVRLKTLPPGFERQYPPEREIDLAARYDGAAGPVRWKQIEADLSARVDLRENISPSENMVAYAAAVVTAPAAMETEIGFGSNDGAKIWLNGELIYSKHVGRSEVPNQDKIPVTLRAGKNTVLVKVENWGRNWAFYLSLRDPDGRLTFSAE